MVRNPWGTRRVEWRDVSRLRLKDFWNRSLAPSSVELISGRRVSLLGIGGALIGRDAEAERLFAQLVDELDAWRRTRGGLTPARCHVGTSALSGRLCSGRGAVAQ